MYHLGEENFRISLIITKAQPIHKGLISAINTGLNNSNETIIVFYDDEIFNYNINQQYCRMIFGQNKWLTYYFSKQNIDLSPKLLIENILNDLNKDNYNKPEFFITHYDEEWINAAKLNNLNIIDVQKIAGFDSNNINIEDLEDLKNYVPYIIYDDMKTYIKDYFWKKQ